MTIPAPTLHSGFIHPIPKKDVDTQGAAYAAFVRSWLSWPTTLSSSVIPLKTPQAAQGKSCKLFRVKGTLCIGLFSTPSYSWPISRFVQRATTSILFGFFKSCPFLRQVSAMSHPTEHFHKNRASKSAGRCFLGKQNSLIDRLCGSKILEYSVRPMGSKDYCAAT